MKRLLILCLAAASSGCISTREQPLAPNMVRIETEAGGTLYRGMAAPATMTAAAKATLARGFTHFKMSEVSGGMGEDVLAMSQSGNQKVLTVHAVNGGSDVSNATITMFREGDPGARDAFDAQAVLTQYGGRQS